MARHHAAGDVPLCGRRSEARAQEAARVRRQGVLPFLPSALPDTSENASGEARARGRGAHGEVQRSKVRGRWREREGSG